MTTHSELNLSARKAAGLPVIACPNCGDIAAHWAPESLGAPGHFTCTANGMTP